MRREAHNLQELKAIAQGVLKEISARPPVEHATVLGLSGDLGAGKTAFTKKLAELLGVTETITSPTFILEKIYPLGANEYTGDRYDILVHIDAYRLDEAEDAHALGWKDLLKNPRALVLVEWPENIGIAMPSHTHAIAFSHAGEGIRALEGDLIL